MWSLRFGARLFVVQAVDERAQHVLWQVQGQVRAVVVGQHGHLLDGVDVEYAPCVDHVLAAEAHYEAVFAEFPGHGGLHFRHAEGYHEVGALSVVYVRVVVVGLEIKRVVKVDDI